MALREAHPNPIGRTGPNRFASSSKIASATSGLDEVRGAMIEKLTPATKSISAAAERMRRSRQRRRDGLRSLRIDLHATDVEALIDAGFLDERNRNDSSAVVCALYKFFEDRLIQ
jgi:hypothetical protein